MNTSTTKSILRHFPRRAFLPAAGLLLLGLLPADTLPGAWGYAPVCAADPNPAGAAGAQWFPRDAEFALRAGRELLARPDFPAALCYLVNARQEAGNDPVYLADLGNAYWGVGRAADAIGSWKQARAAGDTSDRPLRGLRDAYLQTRQWDEAEKTLTEWIARHPEDTESTYRLALLRAADDPAGALDLLAQLQAGKDAIAAQAGTLGTVIRAAAALNDPAYLYARTGEELIRLGEPALAEKIIQKAIAQSPEYGEAYALLGLAQETLGEDPQQAYQQGAQFSPDSTMVCLLYGSWLERAGQLDLARWWLRKAWNQKPGDWTIAAELARVDFAAGDPNTAEAWLLQSVKTYPQNSSAWQALAAFYIENDLRVEESGIPAARQAVLLAPKDEQALDLLGLAWLKAGDPVEAERLLRQAIALNPDFAAAHLHLGISLREQGKTSEGDAELQQAEDLDPQGSIGAQVRKILSGE